VSLRRDHRRNKRPFVVGLIAQKNATARDGQSFLIRWSIQEIRRIAMKLEQRRIQPPASSPGHSGAVSTVVRRSKLALTQY
jgi:hypothetical protein